MGVIEDKLEIMEMISRYGQASDGYDPESWADLFTEDGAFGGIMPDGKENITRGREALLALAKGRISQQGGRQQRHNQGFPVFVDLTPERASLRTYLVLTSIPRQPGGVPTIATTGVYHDELVRTPKGWRFKVRKFVVDPQPVQG